jgi:protein SCO1
MQSATRFVHWIVWGVLAMVVAGIAGVFLSTVLKTRGQPLPVYGDVTNFTLTNQLGKAVSLQDLRGLVWVGDIIFTRCAGPCPAMTRTMKGVQDALPAGSPVKLISLTADPEYDTTEVLKNYASQFGVDSSRWSLLTGPKQAVYDLAIHGLKLAVQETTDNGKPDPDQFIHSTRFVIVDGRGQLRAIMSPDEHPVQEIAQVAQRLASER